MTSTDVVLGTYNPSAELITGSQARYGVALIPRSCWTPPPFPNAPGFRAVDLLAHPGFAQRFRPRVMSTTLALAWAACCKRAAYVTDGGDLSPSVYFAAGIALSGRPPPVVWSPGSTALRSAGEATELSPPRTTRRTKG
jgi:myo-inositol-1(or 4)-monophosphatase